MKWQQAFSVLELPLGATWEEVRQNYKWLVLVWHPDRFAHSSDMRDFAQDKLKSVNEAFSVLEQSQMNGEWHFDSTAESGVDGSQSHQPETTQSEFDFEPTSTSPEFQRSQSNSLKLAVFGIGGAVLACVIYGLGIADQGPGSSFPPEKSGRFTGEWLSTIHDRMYFEDLGDAIIVEVLSSPTLQSCNGRLEKRGSRYFGTVTAVFRSDRYKQHRSCEMELILIDINTFDAAVDGIKWDGRGREIARFRSPMRYQRIIR